MSDRILKFSATWCGPCGALTKALHNVDVGVPIEEVDVDEQTELAVRYGIRGVPTLVFLRGEQEIDRKRGAITSDAVKKWVASLRQ